VHDVDGVGQGRTKVHDVDVCWSELVAKRQDLGEGALEVEREMHVGSARGMGQGRPMVHDVDGVGQGRTMVHDVDVCWSELEAKRQDLGEWMPFFGAWKWGSRRQRGRGGDARGER
jgi:hypothetical protein